MNTTYISTMLNELAEVLDDASVRLELKQACFTSMEVKQVGSDWLARITAGNGRFTLLAADGDTSLAAKAWCLDEALVALDQKCKILLRINAL